MKMADQSMTALMGLTEICRPELSDSETGQCKLRAHLDQMDHMTVNCKCRAPKKTPEQIQRSL